VAEKVLLSLGGDCLFLEKRRRGGNLTLRGTYLPFSRERLVSKRLGFHLKGKEGVVCNGEEKRGDHGSRGGKSKQRKRGSTKSWAHYRGEQERRKKPGNRGGGSMGDSFSCVREMEKRRKGSPLSCAPRGYTFTDPIFFLGKGRGNS